MSNTDLMLMTYRDAYMVFANYIEMVIPKHVIGEFCVENIEHNWKTSTVKEFCERLSSCDNTKEMHGLFMEAEPLMQKAVLSKAIAYLGYLRQFPENDRILYPNKPMPVLKAFFVDNWDIMQFDNN